MNGFSRQIIPTEDGSHTIAIPKLGITYHSNRGAIQESLHVFIEAGLKTAARAFPKEKINVLEMGFGTGLNALLTAIEAASSDREIQYTALEQFPVTNQEISKLNYTTVLGHEELFEDLHKAGWETPVAISPVFSLRKINNDLLTASITDLYHVIYFDAFAPDVQPELWTETVFKKLNHAMAEGGVLTTYCSKSIVRKAMMAAGFIVKKIQGPPGKREMVQAFKSSAIKSE